MQETGQELIITDRAKPVLKIIPFEKQPQSVLEELRNSVRRYDDPLKPVGQPLVTRDNKIIDYPHVQTIWKENNQ